ncbi:peptidoglycan D,D-transpeptidase FtsI family protein [Zongyangia hominis]|uniref:beta-lactamase n=1 Tax=Zongyangia hominis TaxID=2763677 RepID=A0A926IB01_9FIRM|nr:penicillin-binding protein 2 [Zongyangia hominis]MBC8569763.1 penicillin-binding protein 2 [Zongyangia hominis]
MAKRVVGILSVLILLFSLIFFRIFSLTTQDTLAMAADKQSSYLLEVGQSRGMIYDTYGRPLVNTSVDHIAAVVPTPESITALTSLLRGQKRSYVVEKGEDNLPFTVNIGYLDVDCGDITIFDQPDRYGSENFCRHVIGYLDSEGHGVDGLEKVFDDVLSQSTKTTSARYQVDALGRALSGSQLEVVEEGSDKKGVMLTIDRDIQRIAQNAARKGIEKGAVVVMDTATGEIKALVSVPSYDAENVGASLSDERGPLINRTMTPYNVGSTFKLLVCAAALEKGISPDTTFECKGAIDIQGQIFHCHNLAGHGYSDMNRAVEVSCNPYFIQLALQVGYEDIAKMADAMGLGKEDIFYTDYASAAGHMTTADEIKNEATLANLGFGQGTLMATPIQIAKLISAIANGGYAVTPSLVRGVTDSEGKELEEAMDILEPTRIMSAETAGKVQNFMINVVDEGSGKKAKPDYCVAGGKTASAQTGMFQNGEELIHAWFSGFCDVGEHRYAIVVLCEEKESGGDFAAPVFKEIADSMEKNHVG